MFFFYSFALMKVRVAMGFSMEILLANKKIYEQQMGGINYDSLVARRRR